MAGWHGQQTAGEGIQQHEVFLSHTHNCPYSDDSATSASEEGTLDGDPGEDGHCS